ncbi:hypothetical protein FA13DRAFT_1130710 [Coprinellus micaceus]|uniref:Uncharacterized protein n=1 Tax=Coprinellus micaceus TaxID=71717 RepID=A0A4Y7SVA0_COPMI|nr:hypothetical protein FA13DRAFT_1130710 [Coprinellus micaceus]
MSIRRVSLRTPDEEAEEEGDMKASRRNSVSSTNWENARYKRRSGSSTSLGSTTQQSGPAISKPTPMRPHTSRTHTAPSVRPILKSRTPSSQQMAYHFRNGSTGHLHHTQSYHYRDKNYPPYQHQYRKLASASQTSVIRTSMYGQYGWYSYNSDSRKNSTVSLDLQRTPMPERRYSTRDSIYGQSSMSQSRQSLDSQSTYHDREQDTRSWYKPDPQETDITRRATIASPQPSASTSSPATPANDNTTTPRRRATLKKAPPPGREPSTSDRPATSTSNNPSRPLPPEPPTLPHPDLNPGWPPRGWHVYVSAMTQDYLYGGSGSSSAQRPALEDYVFDQDTLTFVRRPQEVADRSRAPTTDGHEGDRVNGGDGGADDVILQAYAYEPSPGPGPRGRATQSLDLPRRTTQSLDLPREHAMEFPFNLPPIPLPPDISKPSTPLSKKSSSEKSKSKPSPKGAASPVAPYADPTGDAKTPTTPNGDGKLAFNQSSTSLASKKSTGSKKEGGAGWFGWNRKRSKSIDAREAQVGIVPPVPAIPTHLQSEPLALGSKTDAEATVNGDSFTASPALCDTSIKDDWAIQAQEKSQQDQGTRAAGARMESNASDHSGSQGASQATPTESDPSISAHVQLDDKRPAEQAPGDRRHTISSASSAGHSPYPSPPSSATGHRARPIHQTRSPSAPAPSPSPSPSPAPSRASTIVAPSVLNSRHNRRKSINMKGGGAYILDTLEGTRIASPYPEPQSTVIRRVSQTGRNANGRSESRVSVASGLSDATATAVTSTSGSTVDLHSRPLSAMSNMTATANLPVSARGSSVDLHSRPMSALSNATITTASATPIGSVLSTPTRGSSLDLASSRPMSALSNSTTTTSARSYSPFPSFSYIPPGSSAASTTSEHASSSHSTPSKSALGQEVYSSETSSPYTRSNGNYYSPSASPSPSQTTTPTPTPTKPKGWRRWTSPLSGSPKKISSVSTSKGASTSKVDVSKARASVDVRVESPIQCNGNEMHWSAKGVNGGGVGGDAPLVWSAPVGKLAPSPSKLRKKRKP